ncbi:putative holin-like toxin [Lactobacillus johnsonii]|nr:putative holin-like toxin [Lactobacillus johnsonii]MDT9606009.1 putative holin-like toxin [Lactobacillus johnsonii]
MSVYEAISVMLLFGTFVLALLTYIDHHAAQFITLVGLLSDVVAIV